MLNGWAAIQIGADCWYCDMIVERVPPTNDPKVRTGSAGRDRKCCPDPSKFSGQEGTATKSRVDKKRSISRR